MTTISPKMKVFILEGCHASGKSTIIAKIQKDTKIPIVNENFYENTRFDPESHMHQYEWILSFVERLVNIKKSKNASLVLCDRGPVSGVIYGGDQYMHIVSEAYMYLEKQGIHVINMILENPSLDDHMLRIISRDGPRAKKELITLERIIERYKNYCKDYVKVKSAEDICSLILVMD